jgi:hypothetical protein
VGKTEEIKDTLNPKFSKSVTIDYYFEEVQKMRFVVVDIDKPTGRIIVRDLGFGRRGLFLPFSAWLTHFCVLPGPRHGWRGVVQS